jgi:hypothetical protein
MAIAKTPEQIELEKEQNKQKIAEAKKAAAEAKLAEETAKKSLKELSYPKSETKGLEGTITASDAAGYVAELLSYESLSNATKKVAKSLEAEIKGKKVIISTSFDVGDQFALWNLLNTRADVMMQQLTTLETEFKPGGVPTLPGRPESITAAIAAAPAILGAVTDISKFFKVDRDIKSRSNVTLSNNSLIAATAASVKKQAHPSDIYILSLDFKTMGALSENLQNLLVKNVEIIALKSAVRKSVEGDLQQLATIQGKIKLKQKEIASEKDAVEKAQLEKELEQLKDDELRYVRLEEALKAAEKRFDDTTAATIAFIDSLTEKSGDKLSLLETVNAMDYLKVNDDAKLLLIEISSAGGEYETSKGSFITSSKISYLGAVVLSYVLIDNNHHYVISGVVPVKKGARYKSLTK